MIFPRCAIFTGFAVLCLSVLSPLASAADRVWVAPTNTGSTYYYYNFTGHWSPGSIPNSSDRAILNTGGNPTNYSNIVIKDGAGIANQILVNQGEVRMWMTNAFTVTSSSINPALPAVDISRANSTGNGATLVIRDGSTSGPNGPGGAFTSQGLTVIGNQANSAGRLFLGSSIDNGSAIYNTNQIRIGNAGQGTLIVEQGAKLNNSSTAYIGMLSDSVGNATVTTGSTWTNTNNLYVGGRESAAGGTGNLTVTNAGHVNVAGTLKLWNAGTVALDGGSITTGSLDRTLGTFNHHDGTLTVNGGAYTQSSGPLTIQSNAVGKNATFVLANGATTSGVDQVRVGNSNQGTLTVSGGSVLSNGVAGIIGVNSGSNGTATVTGNGSAWTNGTDIIVGQDGNGTLNVQNGGLVTNYRGLLGRYAGSSGTATVTGPNSTWNNTEQLFVGLNGNGTLNIQNGGQVSNTTGSIAYYAGISGNATVTGNGSTWTNSDGLYVGGNASSVGGTGSLSVANGGHVDVTGMLKTWNAGIVTLDGGSITTNFFDRSLGTFNHYNGTITINGGTYAQTPGQLTIQGNAVGKHSQLVLTNGATALGITDLNVGTSNQGTLAVNGGNLSISGTLKTWNAGTVTLDGGSITTNSFDRTLGTFNHHDGVMTVDGGMYTQATGPLTIQSNTAGKNATFVLANGATTSGVDQVRVGNSNQGTLTVSGGSVLSNGVAGYIGFNPGSNGTATVTGNGSAWTNGSDIVVGQDGNGTLNIQNGGLVSNYRGVLGRNAGSSGNVTVTGPNSTWSNTEQLFVGLNGNGVLNIQNGGQVSNTTGSIGYYAGVTGNATVTGNGSTWTNSDGLYVGGNASSVGGTGSLSVTNGGHVDVAGTLKTWNAGTVTLDGGSITAGSFDRSLGTFNHHDGTFTVDGGVYSQSSGTLTIQSNAPGKDAHLVLANGATTTGVTQVRVGNNNKGSLMVSGGSVLSNDVSGYVGFNNGSTGVATVTGPGSMWINGGNTQIGQSGHGTLTIENGGQVSNNRGIIGLDPGSTGNATVTGPNSTWTNAEELRIGVDGHGAIHIQNGGQVSNTIGSIGYNAGSISDVTVDGLGSNWANDSQLYVGRFGTGSLNIQNGGQVSNTWGSIGNDAGSTGAATVDGAGSQWTNSHDFSVGWAGDGTLNIQNGGQVSNTWGFIGGLSGATGTATVTGTDSTWTNTTSLYVGGFFSTAGGTGNLTVANGGLVTVGQDAKVFSLGNIDLQQGGTLAITSTLDNTGLVEIATGGTVSAASIDNTGIISNHGVIDANILVHAGGMLNGTGAFNGVVTIGDGGFFSAGNSPGTATMSETVWDTNGTYTWEINALAGYGGTEGNITGWDLWNTGDLTINGPFNIVLTTLDANNDAGLLANWDALGTYQWRIATATNDAFLDLSDLLLVFTGFQNIFDGNFSLSSGNSGNDLYLNYVNPENSTVPEPGSIVAMLSLVSFGLGAIFLRRRYNVNNNQEM